MASGSFNKALMDMLDGTINIDTNEIKIMLVDNTYTYNPDTLVVDAGGASDIVDAEISVTGYTGGWGGAGRKVVAVALTNNDTDNRCDLALNGDANITWTALGTGATIEAAVLIKEGLSDDTTSRPLFYFDHTNIVTNGGDVTLTVTALASGGNMRFSS